VIATDAAGNAATAVTKNVVVDTTAPTASAATQTVKSSDDVVVQSNETGTAYLVKNTVTVTDFASIQNAADNNVNGIKIITAGSNTNLPATGLVDGIYKVYAVDAAGNLSSAAANQITIDSVIRGIKTTQESVVGTSNADLISGGAGKDVLTGGTGNDTFVYSSTSDSTVKQADRITDFDSNSNDVIDFLALSVSTVQGLMKTASVKVQPHSVAWTLDKTGNTQVYVNTSDAAELQTKADMKIVLTGQPTLDASDFIFAASNQT
jgi:hypothetical protein